MGDFTMETEPTIKTILERMRDDRAALEQKMDAQFAELKSDFVEIKTRLDSLEKHFRSLDRGFDTLLRRDIDRDVEIKDINRRLDDISVDPNAPTGRLP